MIRLKQLGIIETLHTDFVKMSKQGVWKIMGGDLVGNWNPIKKCLVAFGKASKGGISSIDNLGRKLQVTEKYGDEPIVVNKAASPIKTCPPATILPCQNAFVSHELSPALLISHQKVYHCTGSD